MQTIRRIPYYGSLAFLIYMPFHVFLTQSLSLLSGGLNEWKIAKDVLLALLCLVGIGMVWWDHKATKLFNVIVAITTIYALLNIGIWVLHPHAVSHTSALLGFTYDLRLFGYLILGYAAILMTEVDLARVRTILLICVECGCRPRYLTVFSSHGPTNTCRL
jgi:hypothetical protein